MSIRPIAAVALALALALAACGGDDGQDSPEQQGSAAERGFLQAMVPHHQAALEMAEVAVERAEAPEIEKLAGAIREAQAPEIAQMKRIHQRLFRQPLMPDERGYEALGLSAADAGMTHGGAAAALEDADPFDKAFVDEMIPHHEGAVRMAEAVLPKTEDAELKKLAQAIIATQKREIERMNAFRDETDGGVPPGEGHGGH
ncbi:MAG: DUF305 domain-containing protein [Actinomycetota bacterium]|nr:DUF305 domain-containing protein [Actinomycetota bacterium]